MLTSNTILNIMAQRAEEPKRVEGAALRRVRDGETSLRLQLEHVLTANNEVVLRDLQTRPLAECEKLLD